VASSKQPMTNAEVANSRALSVLKSIFIATS
jgi:hypothetical protein